MPSYISTTEDVFEIAGRGCIVVPGLSLPAGAGVKVGDRVMLKRPDGSEIETIVRGIEMGSRHPSHWIPILLGKEITKQMVPVGTELWAA